MIVPEEERPAWYGGNKIPDSYLKRFLPKTEDDNLPWELGVFLNQLGEPTKKDQQCT